MLQVYAIRTVPTVCTFNTLLFVVVVLVDSAQIIKINKNSISPRTETFIVIHTTYRSFHYKRKLGIFILCIIHNSAPLK